jgi:hypothetical protein
LVRALQGRRPLPDLELHTGHGGASPERKERGKGRGSTLQLLAAASIQASLLCWLLHEVEEKKERREKRKEEGKEKKIIYEVGQKLFL